MAVTFAESQDDADPQNPAYRRASHFLSQRFVPRKGLGKSCTGSLSEILCVRHNMSKRKSMYAKQNEISRTSGQQSGVAAHS
jgi:hypothetical protein